MLAPTVRLMKRSMIMKGPGPPIPKIRIKSNRIVQDTLQNPMSLSARESAASLTISINPNITVTTTTRPAAKIERVPSATCDHRQLSNEPPNKARHSSETRLRGDTMSTTFASQEKRETIGRGRTREAASRSLLKAITWRMTGTVDTFAIGFLVTGRLTIAGSIAATELLTKLALYYGHERLWSFIHWGRQ